MENTSDPPSDANGTLPSSEPSHPTSLSSDPNSNIHVSDDTTASSLENTGAMEKLEEGEIGKFDFHEDTTEVVRTEELSEIDPHLWGREKDGFYPETLLGLDLKPVHLDYRKQDKKVFSRAIYNEGNVESTLANEWKQPSRCVIKVTCFDGSVHTFGSFKLEPDGSTSDIMTSYDVATQWPSVRIQVRQNVGENLKDKGKFIDYWIFGNSVNHNDPVVKNGFEYCLNSSNNNVHDMPDLSKLSSEGQDLFRSICDKGQMWETRLGLHTEHMASHPQFDRPIWFNTTASDIQSALDACELGDEIPTRQEITIHALHNAKQISIFRSATREDWMKSSLEFLKVFAPVFQMSVSLGLMNFYQGQELRQRQDETKPFKSIVAADFDWSRTVHPRYLTKIWDVDFDKLDRQVACTPTKWESFVVPPVFPNSAYFGAVLSLGLTREHQAQIAEFKRTVEQTKDLQHGFFFPHPSETGTYFVSLVISDVGPADRDETGEGLEREKPAFDGSSASCMRDTRIRLAQKQTNRQSDAISFIGVIIDDPLLNEIHPGSVYAVVRGPSSIPWRSNERVQLEIQVINDSVTLNRARAALLAFGQPQNRQDDVDVMELLIGSSRKLGNTGHYNDQLNNASIGRFLRNARDTRPGRVLNATQMRAVKTTISRDNNGVTLIQGPPGTGKTATLAAIVKGMLSIGTKVMVCGPTNKSVINAKDEFKKSAYDPAAYESLFFHYHNVFSVVEKTMEKEQNGMSPEDCESISSVQRSIFTLYSAYKEKSLNENEGIRDGYAFRKVSFIRELAKTEDHELQAVAAEYLSLLDDVLDPNNIDKTESRNKMSELEEKKLTPAFFEDIKLVFCTLAQSSNSDLIDYYQPDVIIVDETALATTPDLAIALMTYRECVKNVVLIGDQQQSSPVVISKDRNEAFNFLRISTFERVANEAQNSMSPFPLILLTDSYRMEPDIGELVSKISYGGKLVHHSTTRRTDAMQTALEEYFQRFAPQWSGRKRIGIDVSSQGSRSHLWSGTHSLANDHEGVMVVHMINDLLTFKATNEFKILPEHIKVVTPYTGQKLLIQGLLVQQDQLNGEGSNLAGSIEGWTVSGAQSREGAIEIISSAVNRKDSMDIAFLANKRALNVMLSRAAYRQIFVGNWRGWVQAHRERHGTMGWRPMKGMKTMIEDFVENKDIMTQDFVESVVVERRSDYVGPTFEETLTPKSVLRALKRAAEEDGHAYRPAPAIRGAAQ